MSNDWDFYSCQVDNQPASVFLDLGIKHDVPLRDRPCMAYIRLYMISPRADGLSSQEEFEKLIELEDSVATWLVNNTAAIYVGRNTCGGCRDFYFYIDGAGEWENNASKALSEFPEYRYEIGTRPDVEWNTYLQFLYPSPVDLERIQNRRVCDTLKRNGDTLTEPREIDHWAYFPDENSQAIFLSSISRLGFQVRNLDNSNGNEKFGVQFFRIDLPRAESINLVTLPLYEAAKDAGGYYDGWETAIIK